MQRLKRYVEEIGSGEQPDSVREADSSGRETSVSIESSKETLISFIRQQNKSALAIKRKLDATRAKHVELEKKMALVHAQLEANLTGDDDKRQFQVLSEALDEKEATIKRLTQVIEEIEAAALPSDDDDDDDVDDNAVDEGSTDRPNSNATGSNDGAIGDGSNAGVDENVRPAGGDAPSAAVLELARKKAAAKMAAEWEIKLAAVQQEHRAKLAAAEQSNAALRAASEELHGQVESRARQLAGFESELERAKAALERKQAKSDLELAQLLQKLRAAEQGRDAADAQLAVLQSQADAHRQQNDRLTNELAEKTGQVERCQCQLDSITGRLPQLEADAAAAKQCKEELAACQARLKELEKSTVNELKMVRQDLSVKLQDAESMVSAKTLEIKRLRRQIADDKQRERAHSDAVGLLTEPLKSDASGGGGEEEAAYVRHLGQLHADSATQLAAICAALPDQQSVFLRRLLGQQLSQLVTLKELVAESEREHELRTMQVKMLKDEISKLNRAHTRFEKNKDLELLKNFVSQRDKSAQLEMVPVLHSMLQFSSSELDGLHAALQHKPKK